MLIDANHVLRITRGKLNETIAGLRRLGRKPIERLTRRDKRYADEIVTSIVPRKFWGKGKYRLTLWINGKKIASEKRVIGKEQ